MLKRVDADIVDPAIRRVYSIASWVAIVGNTALCGAKAFVAVTSGSSAVYADAANSLSDVGYSVLMLIGLALALKPADESHPHGHRRIEPLVSMVIGLMMGIAGVEAARNGVDTWRTGPVAIMSTAALVVPASTVAVKAGMFAWVRRLGREAKSPALLASARDHLSDVIASAMAFVGILASRNGLLAGDPLGALFVSAWILYNAWQVLAEAVNHLIGGAASPKVEAEIIAAASSIGSVADVHQVIVEHCGPLVRADVHINMDGSLTLEQVHRVSDEVREAIEALPEVDHAYVHVEPIGVGLD